MYSLRFKFGFGFFLSLVLNASPYAQAPASTGTSSAVTGTLGTVVAPSVGTTGTAYGNVPAQADTAGGNRVQTRNNLAASSSSGAQTSAQDNLVDTAKQAPPARVGSPAAAASNQFQLFVQETTGRMLPTFGRDLFDNNQSFYADNALPVPADYVLGPGDEIQLQVSGPIDFSANPTLDRNGQVTLPKIGAVTPVAGLVLLAAFSA